MLNNFPQLVPQQVCLSCDGCCRFKEPQSRWRPKITSSEGEVITARKGLRDNFVASGEYLKTQNVRGICQCVFFNQNDNTCGIYDVRPFDCQLYPFLLYKKDQEIFIYVHLSCPYIQQKRYSREFDDYLMRLKDFLRKDDAQKFFQENLSIAGDYSKCEDEIECLFSLKDLS